MKMRDSSWERQDYAAPDIALTINPTELNITLQPPRIVCSASERTAVTGGFGIAMHRSFIFYRPVWSSITQFQRVLVLFGGKQGVYHTALSEYRVWKKIWSS